MLGWLYRILIGRFTSCRHQWDHAQTIACYSTWDGDPEPDQVPEYRKWVLRCRHCGIVKVKKI